MSRENHKFRISTREHLWKKQGERCAYCNRKITKEQASLDHIIPIVHSNEGYMKDNFIVTCKRCNKAKGDMIIFSNLFDKLIYPIVDVPYFFEWDYIQTNKFKE